MKTVSMQDLVNIIDEKNKAIEAKDETIEIITRMKNKAEKLISESYEKNKSQAKEIKKLKLGLIEALVGYESADNLTDEEVQEIQELRELTR